MSNADTVVKRDAGNSGVDETSNKPGHYVVPWNPYLAVAAVVVIYILSQAAGGLLVSIYPALRHWSDAQSNSWIQQSVVAQFVYVLIVEGLTLWFIGLFLRHYHTGFRQLGITRPKWRDVGYALGGLALYYVTYIFVLNIVTKLIPALNVDQKQQLGFNHVVGLGPLVVTFISLVVLPPIVEEIMFRGFLYGSLKKGMPKIAAALVTSIIFGSLHLEFTALVWVAAIDTFILSLVLVYLREKTGRLYASMGVHALKNVIAFAALFIFHAN